MFVVVGGPIGNVFIIYRQAASALNDLMDFHEKGFLFFFFPKKNITGF